MDRARDELLARRALARDEDSGLGGGHFLQIAEEAQHRRRPPDHSVLLGLPPRHLRQRPPRVAPPERVHAHEDLASRASGFSAKSAAPSLIACTASLTVACPPMMSTGTSRVASSFLNPLERLEPAHVRKLHVEEGEIDRHVRAGEDGQPLLGRLAGQHVIALPLEDELQRATNVLLVIDDEDRLLPGIPDGASRRGRRDLQRAKGRGRRVVGHAPSLALDRGLLRDLDRLHLDGDRGCCRPCSPDRDVDGDVVDGEPVRVVTTGELDRPRGGHPVFGHFAT